MDEIDNLEKSKIEKSPIYEQNREKMDKLKTLKIWKKIEKEKEKNQQKINRRRTKENCRTAMQNYNFRTFKNCLVTFSNQKLLKSITCTILK